MTLYCTEPGCDEELGSYQLRCPGHQREYLERINQQILDQAAVVDYQVDEEHPVRVGYDWYYDLDAFDLMTEPPEWAHTSEWESLQVDLSQMVADRCSQFTDDVEGADDCIGLPLPKHLQVALDLLSEQLNDFWRQTYAGCFHPNLTERFALRQQVEAYQRTLYGDRDEADDEVD